MYEFKPPAVAVPRTDVDVPGQVSAGDRDARLMALDDDQLDAWNERVAICTVDGGMSQEEAEAIAWDEVQAGRNAHAGPRDANAAAGEGRAKA